MLFSIDTSYHMLIASDHECGRSPAVLSISRFGHLSGCEKVSDLYEGS
jgi:hypothetical protein